MKSVSITFTETKWTDSKFSGGCVEVLRTESKRRISADAESAAMELAYQLFGVHFKGQDRRIEITLSILK